MDDEKYRQEMIALTRKIAANTEPPTRLEKLAERVGQGIAIGSAIGLVLQIIQFFRG
jgi:hypothetical protein